MSVDVVLNCFQVFQHKEKISDISSQASNEATLEQMLKKVRKVPPPPGLKATSLAVFLTEHDNAKKCSIVVIYVVVQILLWCKNSSWQV